MIIYTSKDSFLEIPKGLGNLGGNSGGGSGEDLGPLSGSVVELSAVTESEAVKLADLSASTENLASSVGAMATDLEAVSGSVETLTDTVDSQGDSIADLLLDVDGLDGRVSGNTSDIEALSAQTSANTADIAALSGEVESVQVKAYYLDRMSKAERAELFNELWVNNGESNFEPSKYKFYELEDNDEFKGWAEVRLARFDSGRKVYFSVIFQSRNSSNVYQRGISISQDGTYKKNEFSAVVPLVDVTPISAQTTANTAQIETISAATEDLSATTEDIYNEVFYEEEGERYSYIGDLQDAMEEKQDALEAGDGISLDSPTISVKAGKGLYFKEDGTMEVLPGNGLTFSGNSNALSVKIGDGLAFSGDTLVVSGGSGNGPRVIILNLLSQQERLALYTELAPYRDAPTYTGIQSGFPAQDYAFYYWAGQDNSDEFNDRFRGFVPMQLAAIHPDDYGGACFFTGVVYGRQGGGTVVMVRYIIASDGSFDLSRGMNEYNPHPEISVMKIDSGGTFSEDLWSLGNLSNTDITYRLWLRVDDGTNFAQSPMQEYRKTNEEISPDNWRDVYYFSALIPIGSTTYKGQWRIVQTDDWEGDGPYPATSWVAQ